MGLKTENLSFSYIRDGENLISNCCFSMEQGDRMGLFAPSGYGKTTFARLLAGHLCPGSGDVLLDGTPLPEKGFCPVQLIGQHPEQAVNPRWRMQKVLQEAGQMRQEVLTGLGIEPDWLSRFPGELSGGELQRFCIARAMAQDTRYLIADEISTMLDAVTQAQVWQYILLEVKRRNLGLLVISHSRPLLTKVTAKIYETFNMAEGSIEKNGK